MKGVIICLILFMALHATGQQIPERLYRDDVTRLHSDRVSLTTDSTATERVLEVRFRPVTNGATLGAGWFAGPAMTRVEVTYGHTPGDAITSSPCACLRLIRPDGSVDERFVTGRHMSMENVNTLLVSASGSRVSVAFGHGEVEPVFELKETAPVGPGFNVYARGEVATPLIVAEWLPAMPFGLPGAEWSPEEIDRALESATAGPAGRWTALDRDFNTRLASPGGRYKLAVVPSREVSDAWDIVYISGAEVHPGEWHAGMIKGRLLPTPFSNHYDLQWVESDGTPRRLDCDATLEQNAILTLSFPTLDSRLRFRRL